MRILMVHSFHHARGGDTTCCRTLSDQLRAAGHQVIPLAMRHPDNEASTWEGYFPSHLDLHGTTGRRAQVRAALRMFWSPEAARKTRALCRAARPDVAHIHHIHRHLTPSVLWALQEAGIPIVWTVHDYELVCPSGRLFTAGAPCERCRGHRYHQAILRRCKSDRVAPSVAVAAEKWLHHKLKTWELVDRYLCPSQYLADVLVRFGLPAKRVVHLPNFIEVGALAAGEGEGEGWLVAGRLSEEKGVHVALEAARRLPGQRLLVCGEGPQGRALRAQARDLPWVHFLGRLSPVELARTLREVRVVVVPSLWPENFPYAVIEAQAAGRPVIASRVGGIPEQITHQQDGILVRPGDVDALAGAVAALLSYPDRARELGRAGYHRVRRELQPGPHLARVLALYEELCR